MNLIVKHDKGKLHCYRQQLSKKPNIGFMTIKIRVILRYQVYRERMLYALSIK